MIASLRSIMLAALLAGGVAGLFTTGVQHLRITGLIRSAEVIETAHSTGEQPSDHHHDEAWEPKAGMERLLFTLAANILIGVGFSLVLLSALVLTGRNPTAREGAIWGLLGFVVFAAAPALGLAPELPGAAAAPLHDRQLWWIGTVVATAAGLGFILLQRRWGLRAVGLVLLAAPHLVGAPTTTEAGIVPEELATAFVAASLATAAAFWLVLGVGSGFFYHRLATV